MILLLQPSHEYNLSYKFSPQFTLSLTTVASRRITLVSRATVNTDAWIVAATLQATAAAVDCQSTGAVQAAVQQRTRL